MFIHTLKSIIRLLWPVLVLVSIRATHEETNILAMTRLNSTWTF